MPTPPRDTKIPLDQFFREQHDRLLENALLGSFSRSEPTSTITAQEIVAKMRDAKQTIFDPLHKALDKVTDNLENALYGTVRNTFAGTQIIYDPLCLKNGTERLFPESRHRSRRIRKKLVKRFGGEFQRVPTIYRMEIAGIAMIVAHPSHRASLEAEFKLLKD